MLLERKNIFEAHFSMVDTKNTERPGTVDTTYVRMDYQGTKISYGRRSHCELFILRSRFTRLDTR